MTPSDLEESDIEPVLVRDMSTVELIAFEGDRVGVTSADDLGLGDADQIAMLVQDAPVSIVQHVDVVEEVDDADD